VPLIRHGLGSGEQRLDLMQMIDEVVGDPAERLVRRPGVVRPAGIPGDRLAVPGLPAGGER